MEWNVKRGERERPAQRRDSETWTIEVLGGRGSQKAHVTVSRYPDGRACEIFAATSKTGSDMRTALDAWAMTASKALQHGMSLSVLAKTIRHIRDDSAGRVTTPAELVSHLPEGAGVASIWDAIGALLELHAARAPEVGAPCDKSHAKPPCADPQCWYTRFAAKVSVADWVDCTGVHPAPRCSDIQCWLRGPV